MAELPLECTQEDMEMLTEEKKDVRLVPTLFQRDIYVWDSISDVGRLMAMERLILCQPAMQEKLPTSVVSNSLTTTMPSCNPVTQLGTAFLGASYINGGVLVSSITLPSVKSTGHVCCASSLSSDSNAYKAGKFNESDEDYVTLTRCSTCRNAFCRVSQQIRLSVD